MKMARKIIFTAVLLLITTTAAFLAAEVIDKIAVVVNNEVITQREIDRILMPIYEQYRGLYYGDELVKKLDEVRTKVIDQLIDDRLILSEAKKENVEVDEKEVDAKINDVVKRFQSKEQFEKTLMAQNVALKDLRGHYKQQVMVRKLVDQKIGSKITISPIEISDYYNKHSNDFAKPETVKVSNILIRPKEGLTEAAAERQAKGVLDRIHEGCDFAGLAKLYSEGPNASEGGSLGYVKKGDLLPDLEKVVFNMKNGEVSGVIHTSLGYHIFKVEEKQERKIMALSEVRHDVEEAIFRDKIKDKIKDWVGKLKKDAYIAFK